MREELRSESFMEHAMATWKDAVYQLAFHQTSSLHDADDICQDVFLRLLKDGTCFEDDEHLKAWLLRVTVNRCNDYYRSRRQSLEKTTEDFSLFCEHRETESMELSSSDVWKAMQKIPKKHRLIMYLHYVECYSTDDIAGIVRCTPATVRTRLYRARKKLSRLMKREDVHERAEHAEVPPVRTGNKGPRPCD